ncbi:trimethylamine methyltransferase family protein [Tepidibacter aestuarii]|uniref:trimethylamine methyltransferase family protein n=1 Tax=Tepidibacter aestuarii TaxID=2925782 RepID=UPI0020C07799|nr:trimethylamine methyltransferase family protein [Tepidibacter aestuarii]CAH2213806.1 trimethylamine---corrinoid protein Co-methyltransferase [Tepidibacter aestuarii]
MCFNNAYKVLPREKLEEIHDQSIKILEEKGCAFEAEEVLEIFKKNGFKVEGNAVYFTRNAIEDAIEKTPSKFKLTSINESNSKIIGEEHLVQPSGGEVFMLDYDGTRRDGTLKDYANLTKLHQALDNIDIVGSSHIGVSDIDKRVSALYCTLELAKNTDKMWISPSEVTSGKQINEIMQLLEIGFGKKGFLEGNYVTWQCICPNSPLFYSQFACEAIMEYAKWNQPIQITSAPMAGITAPMSIWGVTLLANAEMLAGLVLSQILRPGIPVVPTITNIYGNMQRATWESGAPETALATAAGIQMLKELYKMPIRGIMGGSAAKTIDYQAGFETMQSYLLGALAGVHVGLENVGTLDNLMSMSLEKTVLDDEMVGRVKRILKGVDMNESDFSIKAIMDVDFSQSFLTHRSTIKNCRKPWRPTVSDWEGYETWVKFGSPDIVSQANKKVRQILDSAPESMIDKELEKDMLAFIKSVEKNI